MKTFILLVFFFNSCNTKKAEIKKILIPSNLTWEQLDTGLEDIDSLCKETNTDFFTVYDNFLVYGKAHFQHYTDVDSISVAHEAGIIEYRYLNCIMLEKGFISDTLILSGKPLYFKNSKELVYENKKYLATDKILQETTKDLKATILSKIKNCKNNKARY